MLRLYKAFTFTSPSSGNKSLLHIPAVADRPRKIVVSVKEATTTQATAPCFVELLTGQTVGGTPDSAVVFPKDDLLETSTPASTYVTYSSANTTVDGTTRRRITVNPRLGDRTDPFDLPGGTTAALWVRTGGAASATLEAQVWIWE